MIIVFKSVLAVKMLHIKRLKEHVLELLFTTHDFTELCGWAVHEPDKFYTFSTSISQINVCIALYKW